jgi:hypothetical protein
VIYLVIRGLSGIAPSEGTPRIGSNPTPATTSKLASDTARCFLAVIRFRLCSLTRPRVVDCAPASGLQNPAQMPVRLEHERRVLIAQPLGDCDHRLPGCQGARWRNGGAMRDSLCQPVAQLLHRWSKDRAP